MLSSMQIPGQGLICTDTRKYSEGVGRRKPGGSRKLVMALRLGPWTTVDELRVIYNDFIMTQWLFLELSTLPF